MTFSRPCPPEITPELFENLSRSLDDFSQHVRKHYTVLCFAGGCEPVFSDGRLEDAWVAFQRDKKHATNSMPDNGNPDHFKLSGVLAYWLRRFAPVYDLRDLSMVRDAPPTLVELLKKYPSELPAFDLGLSACSFFEQCKKGQPAGAPAVEANNFDYYKAMCYVMKFKSLSPHSMGMIFRSLYVPLEATG